MKTSEELSRARDYLLEHGWCQGDFEDPGGSGAVCALGALLKVSEQQEAHDRAVLILEAVAIDIQYCEGAGSLGIGPWNDHEGRTFNEVMDVFDRAIILAKERESV